MWRVPQVALSIVEENKEAVLLVYFIEAIGDIFGVGEFTIAIYLKFISKHGDLKKVVIAVEQV